MTALDQYERLESGGLWRENAEAQRRDVLVSFGNATLVISDTAARPLAHWSLPAVVRLNEGERPALFAPSDDATETLEIDDGTMIDAVEQVRRGLLMARPHPGRLRHVLTAIVVLLVLFLGVFWFPNAVRKQTLSVVPQSKRAEMAAVILGQVQEELGQRCESPRGLQALQALNTRLFGPQSRTQIVVLPSGLGEAIALPGGLILLDQAIVEGTDDPNVVAGYALAAFQAAQDADPLGPVIDHAGIQPTLNLLTTGDLSQSSLDSYAATLTATRNLINISDSTQTAFDQVGVPSAPLIQDQRSRGRDVDLEGTTSASQPVLSDGDWIALQGICDT